jgi:nucleoside-diphosphate-sugar epimerase
MLPYVIDRLSLGEVVELSAGTQVRDYLNVAEAGRRIALVAEADGVGPVNICSGKAITVRDFILSQVPEGADKSLLRFGARQMRTDEPQFVVGRPGGLSERGWGKTV